ncbi:MAG: hypothetical protein AM326_08325 [Candidatus Thorarchaeota archaeon SMTZ-45]|nr:MAG: hypothetical protein AM325_09890 [Candidatus Thorarchaeota archaeon SMTZ1-45]KXH75906.1 MAG: hypothetical protein AM326_08325 [Candidatus Thorarchaeota archaeon SMTZ-45]
MTGSDCVRVLADEILKGQNFCLSEPLSYPGIVIVPIVKVNETLHEKRKLSRTTLTEYVHKVIVGSLPRNTCGVFILDSLGDVVAFKLHMTISKFWERISFVERLVVEHYKDTRKPISKDSATARAFAFLMKLKIEGPKGIMSSKSDYFAVSRTEPVGALGESNDLLESTAAVLYAAGR